MFLLSICILTFAVIMIKFKDVRILNLLKEADESAINTEYGIYTTSYERELAVFIFRIISLNLLFACIIVTCIIVNNDAKENAIYALLGGIAGFIGVYFLTSYCPVLHTYTTMLKNGKTPVVNEDFIVIVVFSVISMILCLINLFLYKYNNSKKQYIIISAFVSILIASFLDVYNGLIVLSGEGIITVLLLIIILMCLVSSIITGFGYDSLPRISQRVTKTSTNNLDKSTINYELKTYETLLKNGLMSEREYNEKIKELNDKS